jgi:protein-arginine deiminase
MLANIDDDSLRCVSKDRAGGLLLDVALAQCNDGADLIINGDADVLDLAPLAVKAWPSAPDGATGTLSIDPKSASRVHLFVQREGHT